MQAACSLLTPNSQRTSVLRTTQASFVGHPERRQYCVEGGAFGGFSLTRVVVEDDLDRPFLNTSMECDAELVPNRSDCGTATLANITGVSGRLPVPTPTIPGR